MKLVIASDHAGFSLKQEILQCLRREGRAVVDLGNHGADPVDYPDYAIKAAEMVSSGDAEAGILVCGSGIGMAIVANKFKGVRAAVVRDRESARGAKEHNDANIICLGGRFTGPSDGIKIVKAWLETSFSGGRHEGRLEKIREIERRNFKATSSS